MTSTKTNMSSNDDPNVTPPMMQAIPLGMQHVLAMFASNVTPSIIVAGAAGLAFGGTEQIYLIQMAMLFAGVATLFQTIGVGPIGARLPIMHFFFFFPFVLPLFFCFFFFFFFKFFYFCFLSQLWRGLFPNERAQLWLYDARVVALTVMCGGVWGQPKVLVLALPPFFFGGFVFFFLAFFLKNFFFFFSLFYWGGGFFGFGFFFIFFFFLIFFWGGGCFK